MSSRVKRVGENILTALLVLLTLEAATRCFSETEPPIFERDNLIGRRFRPSLSEYVHNAECGKDIFIKTNRFGFRDDEWRHQKPVNTRRVAVLGDSYVAAEAVNDEGLMTTHLQDLLNEVDSAAEWEVMNFGITGSSTGQQLSLYREVVSKFHPDAVVIAFGTGSDVTDNSRELSSSLIDRYDLDSKGRLQKIPPSSTRATASKMLGQISRFYVWQQNKWRALISPLRKNRLNNRNRVYCTVKSAKFRRAWQLTEAILTALRDDTASHGAKLFIVPLPTAPQIYSDQFAKISQLADDPSVFDAEHPNHCLQEICVRLEITYHSMVRDFRRRAPSRSSEIESEWLFFNGAGHLNKSGHLAAAESLADALVQSFAGNGEGESAGSTAAVIGGTSPESIRRLR
ncbi:MAG: SGNH/GDSL hydrolase family protein [Pirellulales bacterium]